MAYRVAIFRLQTLIILQVVEGQNQQDLHISASFLDYINLDANFVNRTNIVQLALCRMIIYRYFNSFNDNFKNRKGNRKK